MHGRLKVKDSAEKAAEKAREREKKRKKYLAGINVLFDKRASGVHDAECLHVSALLLQANPDALTLWNTRRDVLLALCKEYKDKEEAGTAEVTNSFLAASNKHDCKDSTTKDSVGAPKTGSLYSSPLPVDKISSSAAVNPSDINTSVDTSDSTSANALESAGQASQCNKEPAMSQNMTSDEPPIPSLPSLPATWKQLLSAELHVVSACLQHNPKSYGAWHHRTWVMEQLCHSASLEDKQKAWDSELSLCNLFLTKDERNFHCWDYRRLVVREGGVAAERELRYSLRLIERNLSNFSAWHYRAKLLPALHPPQRGCPHPVEEAVFREELQRVVQAVFTDPGDQSPWFFLRWLLQRQPPRPRPVWLGMCLAESTRLVLVCTFAAAVDRSALPQMTLPPSAPSTGVKWTPASGNGSNRATVWSASIEILSGTDSSLLVSAQFPDDGPTATLSLSSASSKGRSVSAWLCAQDHPQLGPELSEASRVALEELRENCVMLDDVDPNNKWVLLTLVETLWVLGGDPHRSDAQAFLEQLRVLDPLRAGHYTDTKSKLTLEEVTSSYVSATVAGLPSASPSFSNQELPPFVACNLFLSRLCGLQWLACCPSLDLSANQLRSLHLLSQLPLCRELLLDGNPVDSLAPLTQLPNLCRVSLNGCSLQSPDLLQPLTKVPTLRHLAAKNNFQQEQDLTCVQEMFKHLESLDL